MTILTSSIPIVLVKEVYLSTLKANSFINLIQTKPIEIFFFAKFLSEKTYLLKNYFKFLEICFKSFFSASTAFLKMSSAFICPNDSTLKIISPVSSTSIFPEDF